MHLIALKSCFVEHQLTQSCEFIDMNSEADVTMKCILKEFTTENSML